MTLKSLKIFLLLSIVGFPAVAQKNLPIIDVHLHAPAVDDNGPAPVAICIPVIDQFPPFDPGEVTWGEVFMRGLKEPPCAEPIWSPTTDEALMKETIEVLERRNVIGVLSGPVERVLKWSKAAPGRFIPSVQFQIGRDDISPDEMRKLFINGSFAVLGEISNQYIGIGPNDDRMEPYWALAEELDIPVAIHMGPGAPGGGHLLPKYSIRMGNPLLLEEVLQRHPKLRISVMHAGTPFMEDLIAVLQSYYNVYVDIGPNQWRYPRVYFYHELKMLIDAGFADRIMFGSDQMNWPQVIEPAIAAIEEAPFLTQEQKRDIFYNNAARFLRFTEEEIARHHGR